MKTTLLAVSTLALLPFATATEPTLVTVRPIAAPTPPPVLIGTPTKLRAAAEPLAPAAQGTLYSIGEPTDEEQYYLELINRARANPATEGVRLATTTDPSVLSAYSYFSVDLTMMQAEFAALPARPPLALNALLTQAARGHTADLYTNAFQGHDGTDGRTLGQRVTATGYAWYSLGENVYSFAESVWQGHAGFQVDWGTGGTGGMQPGRGHRANIHGDFLEIGIGVINGTNTVGGTTVGPQLVTQDFGTSSQYFVTGVAYYDIDGDSFYDPGEGVGGLTVEVSGSSYYAVTSASGGYAVPVPSATTTRTVTFTGPELARTLNVSLTLNQNAKADCAAAYAAPVVTGSLTPPTSVATTYSFTALPGATGYEWQRASKSAFASDAADSLARVAATTTGTYSPLATDVRYSGTGAYHLAHQTAAPQLLTYPDQLLVGPSASVSFRSRLGYAGDGETASLELSQDGGTTWTALYNQTGTNSAGEASFQARSVSLAAYAGKSVRLRFAYRYNSGSYYPYADAGVGWYIDEISATNLYGLGAAVTSAVPSGRSFAFTPASAGTYLLAVRPLTPGRTWPFGPYLEVNASAIPPFTAWATQQETAASLPAGTIANHPTEDYNNDGVANLAAYALGLSAVARATPPAPAIADGRLRLSYQRDLTRTDATITAQISTDLTTWHALGAAGAPAGFADALLSSNGSVETREASVPLTSGTRLFLRLQIARP